jgi:hypothetical protein
MCTGMLGLVLQRSVKESVNRTLSQETDFLEPFAWKVHIRTLFLGMCI